MVESEGGEGPVESAGSPARLFVALDLDDDARSALAQWRAGIVDSDPGLRPVAADALHVTLCFLGTQAMAEVDAIAAACRVRSDAPMAGLRIGRALWLPRRRPRVLAVAIEDGAGALAPIQSAVAEALRAGGWYRPQTRSFLPHVTVARVGKDARPRPSPPSPPPAMGLAEASTLTLYRSRLSPAGSRYEALRIIRIGGEGTRARSEIE